jgi:shikimate dehydrogenase
MASSPDVTATIDPMTRYRLAVLGDPVEHSKSPQLHTAMLRVAGLEGEYLKVRADERQLEASVSELRSGVWDGLNITMPLKIHASRLADSLAPLTARSGSVNTLVRDGSAVIGHSTDCSAFTDVHTSERFEERSSFLVLGAGGSATAVLTALPDGAKTYISSRRTSRAEELGKRFDAAVVSWGAAVAGAVIVNTTPLGMAGEDLPDGILRAGSGLIDLPYADVPTPAVTLARALGMPHADGHEFLRRQAIQSFRLWTGVEITMDALTRELRKA